MNIFDVLSNDERVIVLSSRENGQVYTWNFSLTLQCWDVGENGEWYEADARTLSEAPRSFVEAVREALRWYQGE